jgi:hypothetical protein
MKDQKKHPWLKTIAGEVLRAAELKEKRINKAWSRKKHPNVPVDFSAQ